MALPIAGLLVKVGAVLCRPLRAKPRTINRTVLAGAALGLETYLVWVALRLDTLYESERPIPMTFAENICQPIHLIEAFMASITGIATWYLYRLLTED